MGILKGSAQNFWKTQLFRHFLQCGDFLGLLHFSNVATQSLLQGCKCSDIAKFGSHIGWFEPGFFHNVWVNLSCEGHDEELVGT